MADFRQIASVMLFGAGYNISWAPVYVRTPFVVWKLQSANLGRSYIIVSEAASTRVKEKTNLLACVISVLTTFVTSFTIPYLINDEYAGLGGRVGFVYGSICFAMLLLAYMFIPELKNRSLEEVDQLFASPTPLRKFGKVHTVRVEAEVVEFYEAKNKAEV